MRGLGRLAPVLQVDISKKHNVDSMVKQVFNKLGSVDIFVNNAAEITYSPLLETEEEDWNRAIDVNLKRCSHSRGN